MTEGLVVVSGYTSIDTALQARSPLRGGETAILTGEVVPPARRGGCAPNAALWLRRLGVPTALAAWLGDDEEGLAYRAALEREGVDLRALEVGPGPSPRSVLVYPEGGDTLCLFHPSGADGRRFTAHSLDEEAGWVAVTVGPESLTRSLLEAFGSRLAAGEVRLAWDVKADRRAFPVDLVARLEDADLVCMNRAEAAFVGEALGLGRAARPEDLLERGAGVVALTRGAEGAAVVWTGGREVVRPALVRAPDPTGAGDAFFAGMLAALRGGEAPPEAARVGVRTSTAHLTEGRSVAGGRTR